MRDTVTVVALVGVVTAFPRVLIFCLMCRERRRLVVLARACGHDGLVLEHRGADRARLALRQARVEDARG